MISAAEPNVDNRTWYTIPAVRKALGISRTYIYRYMAEGSLKFTTTKDGKHRIVSGQEIKRFWRTKAIG